MASLPRSTSATSEPEPETDKGSDLSKTTSQKFEDGQAIGRLQRTLSCKKVWEFDKDVARRLVALDFDETLVQFARTSLARHAEVVMTCCRAGAGGPGTVRIDGTEADTSHFFAAMDKGVARPGLDAFLKELCNMRQSGVIDGIVIITAAEVTQQRLRGYGEFIAQLLSDWSAARAGIADEWLVRPSSRSALNVFDHVFTGVWMKDLSSLFGDSSGCVMVDDKCVFSEKDARENECAWADVGKKKVMCDGLALPCGAYWQDVPEEAFDEIKALGPTARNVLSRDYKDQKFMGGRYKPMLDDRELMTEVMPAIKAFYEKFNAEA